MKDLEVDHIQNPPLFCRINPFNIQIARNPHCYTNHKGKNECLACLSFACFPVWESACAEHDKKALRFSCVPLERERYVCGQVHLRIAI